VPAPTGSSDVPAPVRQASVPRSIHTAADFVRSVPPPAPAVRTGGSSRRGAPDSSQTSRPADAKSSRWSSGRSLVSPLWMM
jgi:hypothetical protein